MISSEESSEASRLKKGQTASFRVSTEILSRLFVKFLHVGTIDQEY